jgi:hypothetical protein
MNDLETFQAVIARITEVRKTKAVATKGGKRYTQVQDRVEAFRHHFGAAFGLETDIDCKGFAKGEPVVARCVIRDQAGRVVATGHAVEFWGASVVNSTSALENAETSAIGRALAALGIHGGEFASVNEIEGVDRKSDAITDADSMRGADGQAGAVANQQREGPPSPKASKPEPVEAIPPKAITRKLSQQAHLAAEGRFFPKFVEERDPGVTPRQYIYEWCRIDSLSLLDTDKDAQARWEVLRKQFVEWQSQQQGRDAA